MPYAALTAYSALWFTGGLRWKRTTKGIKVLILGASGGVGTCAVQMLRAVGATVSIKYFILLFQSSPVQLNTFI